MAIMAARKKTAVKRAGGTGGRETPGGISDAAVTRATGKSWDHWLKVLDRFDVKTHGHKGAAEHLHDEHGVGEWWSQMVVVGYERVRGLRQKHQRPDGYSVSASRVINAPLASVFKAWQGDGPRRWLPADGRTGLTVRRATANKSLRITWADGTTHVEVNFYDRSRNGQPKALVAVQHNKLPTSAAGQKMKKYWASALDALRTDLERQHAGRG